MSDNSTKFRWCSSNTNLWLLLCVYFFKSLFICFLKNPLLDGGDLSTMITYSAGDVSFNDQGKPQYKNRRQVQCVIITNLSHQVESS